MPNKHVIFVHGLGPKPAKERHLQEWRDALHHGLWTNIPDEAMTMAYWSDLREGLDFQQPEVRAACGRIHRRLRGPQANFAYRPDKLFFWSRALISRFLFDRYLQFIRWVGPLLTRVQQQWLQDYYLYFHHARSEIRARLEAELTAASQAQKRVAILSHSMGTVIAYDTLYHNPNYTVDLLVTMGSPLGLTTVQQDIVGPHPTFPPNLRRWLNVFDGIDPVTLPDQRLANDFTLNGAQLIIDRMIRRNFSPEGVRDPHHWFGYLTCQEVSDAVSQFWLAD